MAVVNPIQAINHYAGESSPEVDTLGFVTGPGLGRAGLREAIVENMDIDWRVAQGSVVKLRIFNDPKSFHPTQHPTHLHGWMLHCHIAEHLGSGMMTVLHVGAKS